MIMNGFFCMIFNTKFFEDILLRAADKLSLIVTLQVKFVRIFLFLQHSVSSQKQFSLPLAGQIGRYIDMELCHIQSSLSFDSILSRVLGHNGIPTIDNDIFANICNLSLETDNKFRHIISVIEVHCINFKNSMRANV